METMISIMLMCLLMICVGIVFPLQRGLSKSAQLRRKVVELESFVEKKQGERMAERAGRIRAQRELRKALLSKDGRDATQVAYPMAPIGTIQSCFSTRNGTPRQALLVPLARACLTLTSGGVSSAALEGLSEYSHCWLLYVFHENTDLPCLWKQPAHREFKAKVRVPRLAGKKMGVFATRSPHRPCPIGLTVAKIEGVKRGKLFLSGADVVDGTPVLDVKPYLPYCDIVLGASAPSWIQAGVNNDPLAVRSVKFSHVFIRELQECWTLMGKYSMYSTPSELHCLLKQVLSRDIRSLSQRKRPHNAILNDLNGNESDTIQVDKDMIELQEDKFSLVKDNFNSGSSLTGEILYHLQLEGINVTYSHDPDDNVTVRGAEIVLPVKHAHYSYKDHFTSLNMHQWEQNSE